MYLLGSMFSVDVRLNNSNTNRRIKSVTIFVAMRHAPQELSEDEQVVLVCEFVSPIKNFVRDTHGKKIIITSPKERAFNTASMLSSALDDMPVLADDLFGDHFHTGTTMEDEKLQKAMAGLTDYFVKQEVVILVTHLPIIKYAWEHALNLFQPKGFRKFPVPNMVFGVQMFNSQTQNVLVAGELMKTFD